MVSTGRNALLAMVALAATLCCANPAVAWVQYHVDGGGCGLRWYQSDIDFHVQAPASAGTSPLQGVPYADFVQAAVDGLEAWHDVQCGICTSAHGPGCTPDNCPVNPIGLNFHRKEDPVGTVPTPPGGHCKQYTGGQCVDMENNGNYITVIKDAATWQATTSASVSVFALTILSYNKQSGAIVDADILLKDVDPTHFCLYNCKEGLNNLRNTLTHESGHFIGLDHSPDPEATMYAYAAAGDIKKITLAQDDLNGACTVYRTSCSSQGCPTPIYIQPDAGSTDAGLAADGTGTAVGPYGTACNELAPPELTSVCPVDSVPQPNHPSSSCQVARHGDGLAGLALLLLAAAGAPVLRRRLRAKD